MWNYYSDESESEEEEEYSYKRAKPCHHRCFDKKHCGHPCCKVTNNKSYSSGTCRHRCHDKRNCLHECCKVGINSYYPTGGGYYTIDGSYHPNGGQYQREQGVMELMLQQYQLQAVREEAEREKAAREQAEKERAAREKAARERFAREQAEVEKAIREQAEKEKAAREKAAREQAEKEKAIRELAEKEKAAREQAEKEKAVRERAFAKAARDLYEREQVARAVREQAEWEQAARERDARELVKREHAKREQVEIEKVNLFLKNLGFDGASIQKIEKYGVRKVEDFVHFGNIDWDNLALPPFQKNKILLFIHSDPLISQDSKSKEVAQKGKELNKAAEVAPNTKGSSLLDKKYFSAKSMNHINQHLLDIVQKKTQKTRTTCLLLLKEIFEEEKLESDFQLLKNLESTFIDKIKDPFDFGTYSSTWNNYFSKIPMINPQPTLKSENNLSKGVTQTYEQISNDKQGVCNRVTDIRSTNDRGWFTPVYGLSSMPIVSFEDSLELLIENKCVTGLRGYADEAWTYACKYENPPPKLTRDGIAAIHLYTMEWVIKKTSLYYILNEKLREQNRDSLKYFFPYLKLLLSALQNLPCATEKIIYRGVQGDFSEEYKQGEFIIWWGFSSCTTSLQPINVFTGSGPRTIINIEYINGVKIKEFSSYKVEEEVLLPPGRYFKVESKMRQQDLLIVHLKEYPSGKIDGPFARPFWQWKNECLWEPYDPKTSDIIEKAYSLLQKKVGPHEIIVSLGIHKYLINMKDKLQVNLSTHTQRTIRRFDPND